MYKLSNSSLMKLSTCDTRLQELFQEAIKYSPIDFGITEGHRGIEDQKKYYKEGKSKIDGVNQKGKHNSFPSLAVDIACYIDGKITWDKEYYYAVYGVVETIARQMSIPIRWGGNFKSFFDGCHFELC